jgi:hypothetical protein
MLGAKINSAEARKRPDTGRASTIVAAMFAFSCAASLAAPAAIGCGFHAPLGVQLESMYPGSFAVAVALRTPSSIVRSYFAT